MLQTSYAHWLEDQVSEAVEYRMYDVLPVSFIEVKNRLVVFVLPIEIYTIKKL